MRSAAALLTVFLGVLAVLVFEFRIMDRADEPLRRTLARVAWIILAAALMGSLELAFHAALEAPFSGGRRFW